MLVLALGNPGTQYQNTRHNVGFKVADRVAADANKSFKKPMFKSYRLCTVEAGESRLYLLKPLTYVNRSGMAASQALRALGIDITDMLVVCDNLDLNPGSCRIKRGGKDAGHNGLKSIIECTGSGGFLRLYIGIGHPGRQDAVVDWVLGEPDAGDGKMIEDSVGRAAEAIEALLTQDLEQVMNDLNRKR